jgi:Antitoxin MazE-like
MKALKAHERMRGYRARQRAAGMRLVQLWLPDTRSKRFAAECRRQSRLKGDAAESARVHRAGGCVERRCAAVTW